MTLRTFALAGVVAAALAAFYVALFLQAARQSAGARVVAADGGWREMERVDSV